MSDKIRPGHYGGDNNPYEAIKVIELWGAGFCVGSALKYLCRAGKKAGEPIEDDLKKAAWYLRRAAEEARKESTAFVFRKQSQRLNQAADMASKVAEAWGTDALVLHFIFTASFQRSGEDMGCLLDQAAARMQYCTLPKEAK